MSDDFDFFDTLVADEEEPVGTVKLSDERVEEIPKEVNDQQSIIPELPQLSPDTKDVGGEEPLQTQQLPPPENVSGVDPPSCQTQNEENTVPAKPQVAPSIDTDNEVAIPEQHFDLPLPVSEEPPEAPKPQQDSQNQPPATEPMDFLGMPMDFIPMETLQHMTAQVQPPSVPLPPTTEPLSPPSATLLTPPGSVDDIAMMQDHTAPPMEFMDLPQEMFVPPFQEPLGMPPMSNSKETEHMAPSPQGQMGVMSGMGGMGKCVDIGGDGDGGGGWGIGMVDLGGVGGVGEDVFGKTDSNNSNNSNNQGQAAAPISPSLPTVLVPATADRGIHSMIHFLQSLSHNARSKHHRLLTQALLFRLRCLLAAPDPEALAAAELAKEMEMLAAGGESPLLVLDPFASGDSRQTQPSPVPLGSLWEGGGNRALYSVSNNLIQSGHITLGLLLLLAGSCGQEQTDTPDVSCVSTLERQSVVQRLGGMISDKKLKLLLLTAASISGTMPSVCGGEVAGGESENEWLGMVVMLIKTFPVSQCREQIINIAKDLVRCNSEQAMIAAHICYVIAGVAPTVNTEFAFVGMADPTCDPRECFVDRSNLVSCLELTRILQYIQEMECAVGAAVNKALALSDSNERSSKSELDESMKQNLKKKQKAPFISKEKGSEQSGGYRGVLGNKDNSKSNTNNHIEWLLGDQRLKFYQSQQKSIVHLIPFNILEGEQKYLLQGLSNLGHLLNTGQGIGGANGQQIDPRLSRANFSLSVRSVLPAGSPPPEAFLAPFSCPRYEMLLRELGVAGVRRQDPSALPPNSDEIRRNAEMLCGASLGFLTDFVAKCLWPGGKQPPQQSGEQARGAAMGHSIRPGAMPPSTAGGMTSLSPLSLSVGVGDQTQQHQPKTTARDVMDNIGKASIKTITTLFGHDDKQQQQQQQQLQQQQRPPAAQSSFGYPFPTDMATFPCSAPITSPPSEQPSANNTRATSATAHNTHNTRGLSFGEDQLGETQRMPPMSQNKPPSATASPMMGGTDAKAARLTRENRPMQTTQSQSRLDTQGKQGAKKKSFFNIFSTKRKDEVPSFPIMNQPPPPPPPASAALSSPPSMSDGMPGSTAEPAATDISSLMSSSATMYVNPFST